MLTATASLCIKAWPAFRGLPVTRKLYNYQQVFTRIKLSLIGLYQVFSLLSLSACITYVYTLSTVKDLLQKVSEVQRTRLPFSQRLQTTLNRAEYTDMTFLLPWPWLWSDDLDVRMWSRYSEDVSAYKKMNFLSQLSFQKLEHYGQTDRHALQSKRPLDKTPHSQNIP